MNIKNITLSDGMVFKPGDTISNQLIGAWFRYYGEGGIHGGNAGNESAHNAYTQNATEYGLLNTNTHICVGNNGNGLAFEPFIKYFVFTDKPIGVRANDSGYWCVGGSIVFPIRFGFHDYVATIVDGKYYLYKYNWNIDIGDFTFDEAMKQNPSCFVTAEEIDEEQYSKLVHAEKFDHLPTFFFAVKKYKGDMVSKFQPTTIIKNLSNTFMISRNNMRCFVDNNGKVIESKRLHFPTVNGNVVCRDIDDLELVEKGVSIGGGIFDAYHYKYETSDNSVKNADMISKATNDYDDIFKIPNANPSLPYNHFFDEQLIHLTSESCGGSKKMGAVLYNYSNMVFVKRGGGFKFATVKSSNLDGGVSNEAIVYHKNFIDNNTSKQHKGNKGEDSKVKECFDEIMDSGHKAGNLISSIQMLSNFELNPLDIENPLNHKNFQIFEMREHDWMVGKGDDMILHMEFQNGRTDWGHVEGLNYRLDSDGVPYHVLVVDDWSSNKEKITHFRKTLKNKEVNTLKGVYAVLLSDMLNYNKDEFVNLMEPTK